MRWRVRFTMANGRVIDVPLGATKRESQAVRSTFENLMHDILVSGGCRGFGLVVHPDSPDCDHDLGAWRGPT